MEYDEMQKLVRDNVCAACGGELTIRTNPETTSLEVWCPHHPDHHGYVERETYTEQYRRGGGTSVVIADKIEKKMLPGGYPLGTALALIKTRFPRADMDDPSAALFLMDCIRLDLDPLLGEIVPVTFKSKDKKVVQPVLTEDGWLSLAARACPDRWAGPPATEPITDKDFKKDLCGEEDAWVWKATGKTKDGNESTGYGWLKQSEFKKAKDAGTPAGDLPGNQARVRAIKRWVRETFPEAKAVMKNMMSEWMSRGKDIEGVLEIIEAEYHVVSETQPPKGVEKTSEPGKASATALAPAKTAKAEKAASEPVGKQEGFTIDLTWLNETLNDLKWTEETAKTYLVSKYNVSPTGALPEVISRLTREQAEEFVKEVQRRLSDRQIGLWG